MIPIGPATADKRGYTTWEQVSGYHDGDGSLKVHIGVFTLNIQVDWVDQDREQLEHIQRFLVSHDVTARLGETWTQGRKYF